jgi:hypothetical protein
MKNDRSSFDQIMLRLYRGTVNSMQGNKDSFLMHGCEVYSICIWCAYVQENIIWNIFRGDDIISSVYWLINLC